MLLGSVSDVAAGRVVVGPLWACLLGTVLGSSVTAAAQPTEAPPGRGRDGPLAAPPGPQASDLRRLMNRLGREVVDDPAPQRMHPGRTWGERPPIERVDGEGLSVLSNRAPSPRREGAPLKMSESLHRSSTERSSTTAPSSSARNPSPAQGLLRREVAGGGSVGGRSPRQSTASKPSSSSPHPIFSRYWLLVLGVQVAGILGIFLNAGARQRKSARQAAHHQ